MDMLPIVVYLEQDIVPVVQAIITSNFMKICLFVFLSVIICYLTLYVFAIFLLKKKENIENHLYSGKIKLLCPRRLFEAFSKIKIPDASVLFVPLFAGMFLIWIVFPLVMVGSHQSSNELGDAYGALNTLFSSLAFTAMIVALVLQGKEMSDQREEFKSQGDTAKRVSFENTFFNMLKNQREITSSLRLSYEGLIGGEAQGIYVFEKFIKSRGIFEIRPFPITRRDADYPKDIQVQVNKIYLEYEKIAKVFIFDSYFRNLYRTLKFVDETTLLPKIGVKKTDDNIKVITEFDVKKEYAGILRAQLSTYEIILLFFNSLHPNYSKARMLYEKFSFFDNIRVNLLPRPFLMLSYSPRAFDLEELKKKDENGVYQVANYMLYRSYDRNISQEYHYEIETRFFAYYHYWLNKG